MPDSTNAATDREPATGQVLASGGRRRWIALGILAVSLGLVVLDGTIVGVSLPVIIRDLNLSLTNAEWVNSLYSVVFAALLLTAGRLGDSFGRRKTLVVGIVLFGVGSVLAALSGGAASLIAARAVQGIGGALILPSTLSTVNATFRGKDRAVAFGVWGAVMSGAAALGPLLGGLLTKYATWHWVFWVNVPIGLVLIVAALIFVDDTRGDRDRGADFVGPILAAIGFGALVFGLIEGANLGWWKPEEVFTLGSFTWGLDAPISAAPVALLVGLVFIAIFVLYERSLGAKGRVRILDTSLFSIPSFSWGNLTAGLVAVGEFALIFVLPLYLTTTLGLDTLGAGLVLVTMALGAFFAGASARHLAAALGAARVVILGLALEVVGVAATALLVGLQLGSWWVAATMLVYGVGVGLASAQVTSLVLGDVPVAQSGAGSAVQSTVRQVGSALGAAMGGTVLSSALGTHVIQQATPDSFAHASSWAVWASAAVLAVGLFAALRLKAAVKGGSAAAQEQPAEA
ncbi:MFS transporter [Tessaracoccus aquimaris]|uniref:MFS transporter n=1 Tax=Tessaracoccus aquimaris TaxID=1332264 RepID=A0A1Q2CSI8_9ACTN|nr:MFS transporter [Tessaracoccus aquimaris]AQP49098.1 MFS transporter [Tessaracoccus aquimaris]